MSSSTVIMNLKQLCVLISVIFCGISVVMSQRVPPNPCPDIFAYKQAATDSGGGYFGEARVPYDDSRRLAFAVNVSMIGYFHNLKLTLKLLTPLENIPPRTTLRYRVDFPLRDVVPRVTHIVYNGRVFCNGPQETLGPSGVTNLWAGLNHAINYYTYPVGPGSRPITGNNIGPGPDQEWSSRPPPFRPAPQEGGEGGGGGEGFRLPDDVEIIQRPAYSPEGNPFLRPTTVVGTSTQRVFTSPQIVPTARTPEQDSSSWSCGVANDLQTLVVNGERTTENEYPWLVAMYHRQGVTYQYQCTSNLVSDIHAVTAAHCVQFHKSPLVTKEDVLLIMGRSNLTNWALSDAILRKPSKIVVHPEYRQYTGHCDVAVVKFDKPVTFGLTLRPVCLWRGDNDFEKIENQTGMVAGWGKDESGRQTVAEPRRVMMPLVSQEDCLRSNSAYRNLTSTLTFCAGSRNGSGPCGGDSGAGFLLKQQNKWYLRGLVSVAIQQENTLDCNLNEYLVFCDIAKLQSWVKAAMT